MFSVGVLLTHFTVVYCIYSSSDKTVKVWEASSRECLHTAKDHTDQVGVLLTVDEPLVSGQGILCSRTSLLWTPRARIL